MVVAAAAAAVVAAAAAACFGATFFARDQPCASEEKEVVVVAAAAAASVVVDQPCAWRRRWWWRWRRRLVSEQDFRSGPALRVGREGGGGGRSVAPGSGSGQALPGVPRERLYIYSSTSLHCWSGNKAATPAELFGSTLMLWIGVGGARSEQPGARA